MPRLHRADALRGLPPLRSLFKYTETSYVLLCFIVIVLVFYSYCTCTLTSLYIFYYLLFLEDNRSPFVNRSVVYRVSYTFLQSIGVGTQKDFKTFLKIERVLQKYILVF